VTPARLRTSAVFNAFMSNLPQVLDQNHLIGWCMLPTALQVLLFSPNPLTAAIIPGTELLQTIVYSYSLWYLEPHVRRNWLLSVLIVLYKV